MKKLILFMVVIFIFSCNSKRTEKKLDFVNTVFVKNGKGENAKALCTLNKDLEKRISYADMEEMVNQANSDAKISCKNINTYVPSSFMITPLNGDTIDITAMYSAENSYGVPDNISGFFTYVKKNKKYELIKQIAL